MDLSLPLALIAFLVLVNAGFAGSEIALISLRESQVSQLEGGGGAGKTLALLARDPNRFLATIQIGSTLAGFLASATAAVAIAEPLVEPLRDVVGAGARPVAVVGVTLLLTFVTLVIGELAPKRVAMQRTERWALAAARPISAMAAAARPAIWLLGRTSDLVVRAAGGDPDQQREEVTAEELRAMVAVQPELTEEERAIIHGAFDFADRTLREILVPRSSVVALPADLDATAAIRQLVETGHTRAPVFGCTIDDVVGTVHLRSLIDGTGTVGEHRRPALVLPETAGCLETLRHLQRTRQQMVIVIDEHGSTAGIVTVEDLLEEVVGDIWDEADPHLQAAERHPDGGVTVDGSFPIHELPDLGIDVPSGKYTTIAGLLLQRVGRIPAVGEVVEVGRWQLRVDAATDRAVRKVRIDPHPSDAEAPAD